MCEFCFSQSPVLPLPDDWRERWEDEYSGRGESFITWKLLGWGIVAIVGLPVWIPLGFIFLIGLLVCFFGLMLKDAIEAVTVLKQKSGAGCR